MDYVLSDDHKKKLEQLPRMPIVIGAVQDVLLGDGWEG